MSTTLPHLRRCEIDAAAGWLETSFPDDLGVLDGVEKVRGLQKLFAGLIRTASALAVLLHREVDEWREAVVDGSCDFDADEEGDWKNALRALTAVMGRLGDKEEAYRVARGVRLALPGPVNRILAKKARIERTLRHWKSPSPSTAMGLRRVEFDRKQSAELLARIAAAREKQGAGAAS